MTDATYRYTVTAVYGSWTSVSTPSPPVSVVNDSSLPTISVASISPTPNGNGYNNTSPVRVNLLASDASGIASITSQVDGGTPVVVYADTATITVTGDGVHAISFFAKDNANKTSATGSLFIRIDTASPAAPSAPVLTAASDSGSSNSDGITNVATPTFTGTAEADSTVALYDGAALIGTGVATNGTYTIISPTLAGGDHTMTARATDAADNTGPASGSTSVTIDTLAPSAPSAPFLIAASDSGTSSTDRLTNVVTPTLTGTAEDLSTVKLYNTSTLLGTTQASAGAYSIVSSTLTTGAKTLTATATDRAGNVSPASASTVITIDITAPTKPGTPVLAAASDTGRSNSDKNTRINTPQFTGTVTSGTIVSLHDGGTQIASYTTSTATYAFTSPVLADGSRVITTRATDAAGNVSVASTSITVIIDTIAPVALTAPTLSAASDAGRSSADRITNVNRPVITGSNESKAIVVLYEGAAVLGSVTTTGTTYSITSALLSDGDHTLTAIPTDIAGNVGPVSPGTTISIDTVVPAAPSTPLMTAASDTGISSTDGITKTTKPTLTGTAEAEATVTLFDGGVASGTGVIATGGAYSAVTATLTTGAHVITARAVDVAGNSSGFSGSTNVTIDTTAPTVTLNQAASQADPTSGLSIDYTVVFSEPVLGFVNTHVTLSGTALATTVALSGTGPTYNAAVSGMTKTGTVIPALAASVVQDVAGNLNAAAVYTDRTVTYNDVTPPAPPSTPLLATASDTGISATDGITKTTTPTFTGTAEIGSTVKLFAGAAQVGSVLATTGTYSIAASTLSNGVHTITATATDAALNVSPASGGTSVTIDTVVPTVTLNQAATQPDPTTGTSIDFAVVFSEPVYGLLNSHVTMSGTAGATAVVLSGTGPTYNAAVSGMTKSGTVIPAIAASVVQDVAGNLNTAATFTDRTVTFSDVTAPAVQIDSFTTASQAATVSGLAGRGLGDNLSVTVVLCAVNSYPCLAGNTRATLTGVAVHPTTGVWSVTSGALGSNPALYAQATQTDQTGNTGTSAVAGPIAIP